MPFKLLLIVWEQGYLENTPQLSLHVKAYQYTEVKKEEADFTPKNLTQDPMGRSVPIHL